MRNDLERDLAALALRWSRLRRRAFEESRLDRVASEESTDMADRLEARIVLEKQRDGSTRVSLWDPQGLRHVPTGIKAPPAGVEQQVTQLKEQLEAKGLHATVHEKEK